LKIRPATERDLENVQRIERAAGGLFSRVGMEAVAAAEPPSIAQLLAYVEDERAFVAADDHDLPFAYVLVDEVDGCAHVEQVSVHPDQSGRGVGRDLIEHIATWADARGLEAVTLTTFRDVPWNAPYYERLGFRALADVELSPELRRIRSEEVELDREAPRVAMKLELRGG